MPVALTRYGRVIAILSSPDGDNKVEEIKQKIKSMTGTATGDAVLIEADHGVYSGLKPFVREERRLCAKHGNPIGLCKMGCTK